MTLLLITTVWRSEAVYAPQLSRNGSEIMVCGQLYSIGSRVVLWTDPRGFDAYRVLCRFCRLNESSWAYQVLFTKSPYTLHH
jgi:hypothetical protein